MENIKEGVKYIAGIDPVNSKGNSMGMVITKHNPDGTIDIVDVKQWKNTKWFQRLRFRYWLWRIKWKYRKVVIMKETNEPSKPIKYFS